MIGVDTLIGISLAVLALGAAAGVGMSMFCCGQRICSGRSKKSSGGEYYG